MRKLITESHVEEAVIDILKNLGYEYVYGLDIAPAPEGNGERKNYQDVILDERLKKSLKKINPSFSDEAIERAAKQVIRSTSQKLIEDNQSFHKLLIDGIDVPIKVEGKERYKKMRLFDYEHPKNNEFLVINQFTIKENNYERRPDVILFVNGIPLVVIELKNLAEEKATVWSAYNQFQTYKDQIPSLFRFNEFLIISDGIQARAGTITSQKERFMQWKTIDGKKANKNLTEIDVLLKGMCEKTRLLDIIRNFIVFEKDKKIEKKLAAYHQYWATNKAIESTIKARKGNKKAGVVWHTQGSGKSLTMIFYAGKLVRELDNPTLVLLTDRNDLDDQLFGTFGKNQDILRQKPVQAESRKELQNLLKVSSGGVVFTTIQKFFPEEGRE